MSEPTEHIAPGNADLPAYVSAPPGGHTEAESPFNDTQWAVLRSEDYAAGKAVVVLMLGIFSIGVFLYAAVAFTVWNGSGFLS